MDLRREKNALALPANRLPSERVRKTKEREILASEACPGERASARSARIFALASLAIKALENFTGEPVRRQPLHGPQSCIRLLIVGETPLLKEWRCLTSRLGVQMTEFGLIYCVPEQNLSILK